MSLENRFAVALIAATLSVLLARDSIAVEPQLVAKPGRGAGVVKVRTEEGAVVMDVTSSGGIGQMTVQNGGQPWPMSAKVRLRYDEKRAFTHLEGLTLTDSKSRLHTFLGGTDVEVDYLDGVERRDARKPQMKVDKVNGTIEVTLPLSWFADEKEFVIHWVDFYRG